MTSSFLLKHSALITALGTAFAGYSICASEIAMNNSATFPAIGLFLGISSNEKSVRSYAPIEYSYILCVFDVIDIDDAVDYLAKQQSTFDLLESIINTMDFTLASEIEPVTSIAQGEGSFITGWTTAIRFNA